jgi:hypothetical protein
LEEIVAARVKKTETNDREEPLRSPPNTALSAKVGTTSTSGGRLVGIVRSRAKATEFFFIRLKQLDAQFQSTMYIPLFRFGVSYVLLHPTARL